MHAQNEQTKTSTSTKKTTKTFFIAAFFIIVAFVVGLIGSNLLDNTEEESVITMAKTDVANYYSSRTFIDPTELDLDFSEIEAELVKKENEDNRGLYKVTGEVVFDGTKEEFTSSISYYKGMYFIDSSIMIDEES